MTNFAIDKVTKKIFNHDCDDEINDLTPEVLEDAVSQAKFLIDQYGWPEVFESWFAYLKESCTTPEQVANFCNLYFEFGGSEQALGNLYEFLGYILYRLEFDPNQYYIAVTLDMTALNLLEKAGVIPDAKNVNGFSVEEEPGILAAARLYEKNKGYWDEAEWESLTQAKDSSWWSRLKAKLRGK